MLWFFLLFLITFIFLSSSTHDNFSFLVGSIFLNSGTCFHRLCHFPDSNTVRFILSVTRLSQLFLLLFGCALRLRRGLNGLSALIHPSPKSRDEKRSYQNTSDPLPVQHEDALDHAHFHINIRPIRFHHAPVVVSIHRDETIDHEC